MSVGDDYRILLDKESIVVSPSQQYMLEDCAVGKILVYMELNEWLNLNSFFRDLVQSHFDVDSSFLAVYLKSPMIDVSNCLDSNVDAAAVVLAKLLTHSIQPEYRNPDSRLLGMILSLIMENGTILRYLLPKGLVKDVEYSVSSLISY